MLTIDKTKVDAIIDELLGNNNLTASPEVWYGLHQIKTFPVTEIVRCGECEYYERSDLSEYCNNPETYAIKTDSEFGCILGKRRIDE